MFSAMTAKPGEPAAQKPRPPAWDLSNQLTDAEAAYALIVDAKDEAAAAFYRHHGFIALPDSPFTLFLPLATVEASRKTENRAR